MVFMQATEFDCCNRNKDYEFSELTESELEAPVTFKQWWLGCDCWSEAASSSARLRWANDMNKVCVCVLDDLFWKN